MLDVSEIEVNWQFLAIRQTAKTTGTTAADWWLFSASVSSMENKALNGYASSG